MGHFYDVDGKPIATDDTAWPPLAEFFGAALAEKLTVLYQREGTSHFIADRNVIYISAASLKGAAEPAVVAHETAHRALAVLTEGASATEPFRFMDEGLAMIIEKTFQGSLAKYRRTSLLLAAKRLSTGSVQIADLQHWSKYFGDPTVTADWDAYNIGSAFDFFVQDTFGNNALKRLFVDLGKSRSLQSSVKTVLGKTLEETEAAWVGYLRAVPAPQVPAVVEMDPANGTSGVARDLAEIHATFDTDMAASICVRTDDCAGGICYEHALWRDPRTLVISIDQPLAAGHEFALSLGYPPRCVLKSSDGVEAPVVQWGFRTR